jgi:hypothetical protein
MSSDPLPNSVAIPTDAQNTNRAIAATASNENCSIPAMIKLELSEWIAEIQGDTHSSARVKELDHRKSDMGMWQHEYVVAEVVDVDDSGAEVNRRFLRMERSFHRGHSGLALRLKYGGSACALDTVTTSSASSLLTSQSDSLYTVRYNSKNAPSLWHLACLLRFVASIAPRYHLYTHMCYSYARMVYEGLIQVFSSGIISKGAHHSLRGTCRGVTIVDKDGEFMFAGLRRRKVGRLSPVQEVVKSYGAWLRERGGLA